MPNLILEICKRYKEFTKDQEGKDKKDEFIQSSYRSMPLNLAKAYIDKATGNKWEKLIINCEDPTLYDELIDLMEYSSNKNMDIQLYTMGKGLNKDILETMHKVGLKTLIIPFQSLNYKTHNKLYHGEMNFYDILCGMNILREMKLAGFELQVCLQFVITKYNYQDMPALLQFGLASKFDSFEFFLENPNYPGGKNFSISRQNMEQMNKKTLVNLKKIVQKSSITMDHKQRNLDVLEKFCNFLEKSNKGQETIRLDQEKYVSIVFDPKGGVYLCDETNYYGNLSICNNIQSIPLEKLDQRDFERNNMYFHDIKLQVKGEDKFIYYFNLILK